MGCSSSIRLAGLPARKHKEEVSDSGAHANDFLANFILGVRLGQGSFGQVRDVTQLLGGPSSMLDGMDGSKAVKILRTRNSCNMKTTAKLQANARKEAGLWKSISAHPNCVRLHDQFFEKNFCFFVMEKCSCGLFQALDTMGDITDQGLGNIFAQMLQGIAHCHRADIVHRDIKHDHFLMGGENGRTVKLADFGLAAALPQSGYFTGTVGTLPYMCPEMLRIERYDEKADVWSFAVVVYAMVFGQFPYMPRQRDTKSVRQAIITGTPPPSFAMRSPASAFKTTLTSRPLFSDKAVLFVKALLIRNSASRPSAQRALAWRWMRTGAGDQFPPNLTLPSGPMLESAEEIGAFEMHNPQPASRVDSLLNAMQLDRHGVPLPDYHDGAVETSLLPKTFPKRSLPDARPKAEKTCGKDEQGSGSKSTSIGTKSTNSGTRSTNSGSSVRGTNSDHLFQNNWRKDVGITSI